MKSLNTELAEVANKLAALERANTDLMDKCLDLQEELNARKNVLPVERPDKDETIFQRTKRQISPAKISPVRKAPERAPESTPRSYQKPVDVGTATESQAPGYTNQEKKCSKFHRKTKTGAYKQLCKRFGKKQVRNSELS